jgi:hypothetical protein
MNAIVGVNGKSKQLFTVCDILFSKSTYIVHQVLIRSRSQNWSLSWIALWLQYRHTTMRLRLPQLCAQQSGLVALICINMLHSFV